MLWFISLTPLEKTTLILSVVGVILSLYNFIYHFYSNRKRIEVTMPNLYSDGNSISIVRLNILNKSREAISIYQIEIGCYNSNQNNNSITSYGKYRTRLAEQTSQKSGEIYNRRYWYSDILPIRLDALGYSSGLYVPDDMKCSVWP